MSNSTPTKFRIFVVHFREEVYALKKRFQNLWLQVTWGILGIAKSRYESSEQLEKLNWNKGLAQIDEKSFFNAMTNRLGEGKAKKLKKGIASHFFQMYWGLLYYGWNCEKNNESKSWHQALCTYSYYYLSAKCHFFWRLVFKKGCA